VEKERGTANCMSAWCGEVLSRINKALDDIPTGTTVDADMLLSSGPAHAAHLDESVSTQRAIRRLREHFVITYCDKAPIMFVFVCKRLYCQRLSVGGLAGRRLLLQAGA
jgi:hypothetical protein